MNPHPLHIAIDGPVASGKGEIAARIAKKYNLLYIYTGAMYRSLALACIRAGVPLKNEKKVVLLMKTLSFMFREPDSGSAYPFCILLNGEDVTERITWQDTAQGASDVGSLAGVRQWMVSAQREMAADKAVVMEGRDIAVRVLPEAQLKIFLTASVEERATRRFLQWKAKNIHTTYEETLSDTKIRDAQDMSRGTDPLAKVPDAWELDTTGKKISEIIDIISKELIRRKLI